MSKVVFELMRWPEGLGLNICTEDKEVAYALGGVHGGGIGHPLKHFIVDADQLKEYVERWKYE